MKQKNIFLIYFLVYFLNGSVLSATLKVKSNQMFGELNDLQASGVNLDEIAKVKDLSGLESMLSSVGNDKNSDKNTVDQVKNEILKETMNGEDMPNNKTMDINESDIDKMIKNKEEKLELNPNAILESLDNKNGQTKKEDETLTGMETCEEIKKYGKQRIYCEEKYLLKYGEEKTVNCMKNFCSICCEADENCKDKCSTTHSFFNGHDPEEMFISVCSFENMGPAFKNFCGSMIVDDNKTEYDQCFTNFCFDCCSNELKINDFNDIEIQKCLKICKEGKNKKESTQGKTVASDKNKSIAKNAKPIELSDEIKKILEKPKDNLESPKEEGNNKELSKIEDLNTNLNTVSDIQIKNNDDESRLKTLIQENKISEQLLKSTPVVKKKQGIKINLKDNMSRKQKNTKICEVLILNLDIDSYGKEVAKSCQNDHQKYHFANSKDCLDNLCEDCCGFLEIESEITFCKKQCSFQEIEIFENKNTNENKKKSFLKRKDFVKESVNEVNEEKSIEIVKLKEQMLILQQKISFITTMNQNKENAIENKISELNKNKLESVRVDKEFVNELKTMKLSVKSFNNTEIFPHFLNSSRFKDINFVYFKLIDSLCQSRYFKNCKETLCNDYCNDSPNIVNEKCFKECTMFINKNPKEDLYQYIIKRHAYYEAKLDVIDDKLNIDFEKKIEMKSNSTNYTINNMATKLNDNTLSEDEKIDNLVKNSKDQIKVLNNKLIMEEKNLLGIYLLKRNK